MAVPAIVADAGDHAARRFLEFFAATIRNKRAALRRWVRSLGAKLPRSRCTRNGAIARTCGAGATVAVDWLDRAYAG